jgi:hypothetical protein
MRAMRAACEETRAARCYALAAARTPSRQILCAGKWQVNALPLPSTLLTSSPRAAGVHPVKALGEPRDVLRGNADAGIDHCEVGALLVAPPAHAHGALLRRVFEAVDQQIGERRLDFVRRAEQSVGGVDLQEQMPRPGAPRQCVAVHPFEHARHVDGLARRFAVGGLQPGQLQEIGDDRIHALRLRAHVPDRTGPGLIDGGVVGHRVEIAGNHGQRGAQLVRGIRDEILAHCLEPHLPGHIPCQEQRLARPIRDHLQREIQLHLDGWPDDQRQRKVVPVQIMDELRRADQIVDPQTDIDRTPQPEQPRGLPVEPDDLVLAAQDDDAVGKRGGRAAQFAKQLHQALFVKLFAPVQTHHLADDVAPDAADGGRIELRPQSQPPVEAIEIEQLPAEIEAGCRQHPQPDRSDSQAEAQPREQDAREPRQRKSPHRRHDWSPLALSCPASWPLASSRASKTGSRHPVRSAPNPLA